MPLTTEIKRNNRRLSLRWGGFHVAAMFLAAAIEQDEGVHAEFKQNDDLDYPKEPQPINPSDVFTITSYPVLATIDWPYTLKQDHAFLDSMDGEVFKLKKGDVLDMGRTHK